jgi:membrane-associated phospholipid phosphatase
VNPWWLIVAAAGLVILGLSIADASKPRISDAESRVFHAVNDLPGWLFWVLWPPMQLGNLVVGAVVGAGVALAYGDTTMFIGVVLAVLLKFVTERIVRAKMADYLSVRQRPGTSQVGTITRGYVPKSGPSFPSGHVILVAAVGSVVAPSLDGGWIVAPIIVTAVVMLGRVYVGAHNPLDVTAGAGAGMLLGGVLAAFV